MGFKDEHSFDSRLAESSKIRQKYADRIPVIVEKAPRSNLPAMDKPKYLVPADLTVGQLVYIINRRLSLSPGQALFIFVGKVLPQTGAMMMSIYNDYKDKDGFLYVTYSGEEVFGGETI
ncbi:hypothetical protein SELMODRAFT_233421 [Selaginella moellendorffii]|uniref:Autophagy-related protein n=1 Tax=Selaginella moellendorffii TaxID=88036 RepID=D8S8W8_SELML|nr:autophagy-related protein 8 [Selaginella moellendorffii]XP_002988353.1 autophagy-related protein 8 [Selaginella moellendorffii]EFJ10443.1 hypothetical protein SELMODRAFT_159424 [Selaginella moellendorffii]EFJ19101.1 hypothetical protein SELMODRAFT_233421 [Selaginella moellendorffii]|eukprot:XP_002979699.1 autophagy-related protein 8 [Selaginella moellendorffii]